MDITDNIEEDINKMHISIESLISRNDISLELIRLLCDLGAQCTQLKTDFEKLKGEIK